MTIQMVADPDARWKHKPQHQSWQNYPRKGEAKSLDNPMCN